MKVETATSTLARIQKAWSILGKSLERMETCRRHLNEELQLVDDGPLEENKPVFSNRIKNTLISNFREVVATHLELTLHDQLPANEEGPEEWGCDTTRLSGCVPGYKDTLLVFERGAQESKLALADFERKHQQNAGSTLTSTTQRFSENLEGAVVSMLLYVQAQEEVRKMSDQKSLPEKKLSHEIGEDAGKNKSSLPSEDLTIEACCHRLEAQLALGGIVDLCSKVDSLLATLADACDSIWNEDGQTARLLDQVQQQMQGENSALQAPLRLVMKMSDLSRQLLFPMHMISGAFWRESLRYVSFHKAVAKLAYVTTSLFAGLVREGFCVQEDTKDGDVDNREGGSLEEEEGTGIGEGTGRKDVSEKIDNEDQVVGLQKEQDEDQNEDVSGCAGQ